MWQFVMLEFLLNSVGVRDNIIVFLVFRNQTVMVLLIMDLLGGQNQYLIYVRIGEDTKAGAGLPLTLNFG